MSISNYLELKILDAVLRGVVFSSNPQYVSLHTADPGETGASEVSGSGYARQQITTAGWNAAVSGLSDNINAIAFTNLPAATITHAGLWDSLSGGNFLWGGPLNTSQVVAAGESYQLNPGSLDVTLD